MDLVDTLNIAASGLAAQRVRLQTVASNMANARTTRTAEGGPYRRQAPIFEATPVDPFGSELDSAVAGVSVVGIQQSETTGVKVHDPGHPDADAEGFVTMPDVNMLHEMVDLITTNRSYEANANVVDTTFQMAQRAMEIGR